MQFKLSAFVALLALSSPLKVIAESANNGTASVRAIPDIKEVVKTTPAPADKGRTLGLLYYGLFSHLFGKGGYYNGGYIRPCGNCGGTRYYGDWNGYYGFYSYGQNIRYVNNYDGTYTLYVYGIYGGGNSGILAITCPDNSFRFTPYYEGYYSQINKYSQCVSRII